MQDFPEVVHELGYSIFLFPKRIRFRFGNRLLEYQFAQNPTLRFAAIASTFRFLHDHCLERVSHLVQADAKSGNKSSWLRRLYLTKVRQESRSKTLMRAQQIHGDSQTLHSSTQGAQAQEVAVR